MAKKMAGKELAEFEAGRDIWKEIADGVSEIQEGRGKRIELEPKSPIARIRLASGLTQVRFAELMGVSPRTLEQWEQGRRAPSGAARTLLKVTERHPEVLRDAAA